MSGAIDASSDIYLGIMTGTSLDAIDVAVCRFPKGDFPQARVQLLGFHSTPWPEDMRDTLMSLATSATVSMDLLVRSHFLLAKYYADAVDDTLSFMNLSAKDIRAIGLHGQTVRHLPITNRGITNYGQPWLPELRITNGGTDSGVRGPGSEAGGSDFSDPGPRTPEPESPIRNSQFVIRNSPEIGATLQLGSGSALAALSGIDVISDFRSADVALGGQGAPLVPMFDYAFLRSETADRLIVNIGGIANVTWLPQHAKPEDVVAFDCGPGNMMIDSVTEKYFGEPFDRDGNHARKGTIDEALLVSLLSHPYFQQPPPKSTGRELFGETFLRAVYEKIEDGSLSSLDALATLTELTARSIVKSIPNVKDRPSAIEIIVSGGGAYNNYLCERISIDAGRATVLQSDVVGIPANAKEAIAFAFFAFAFLEDIPIHLPLATGAIHPAKLGSLSRGSRDGMLR